LCLALLSHTQLSSTAAPTLRFDGRSWTAAPRMCMPRVQAAMAAYDGKLYVFGGHDRHTDNADQKSAEVFDGVSWSILPCPIPARKGVAASVYNGCLYVMGGQSGTRLTAEVVRFDGSVWSRAPPMLTPRTVFAAAVL
jgi:hypothetical protein